MVSVLWRVQGLQLCLVCVCVCAQMCCGASPLSLREKGRLCMPSRAKSSHVSYVPGHMSEQGLGKSALPWGQGAVCKLQPAHECSWHWPAVGLRVWSRVAVPMTR